MRKTWRTDAGEAHAGRGPYEPGRVRPGPAREPKSPAAPRAQATRGGASEWLFAKGGMCVVVLGGLMAVSVAAAALVPLRAAAVHPQARGLTDPLGPQGHGPGSR